MEIITRQTRTLGCLLGEGRMGEGGIKTKGVSNFKN